MSLEPFGGMMRFSMLSGMSQEEQHSLRWLASLHGGRSTLKTTVLIGV